MTTSTTVKRSFIALAFSSAALASPISSLAPGDPAGQRQGPGTPPGLLSTNVPVGGSWVVMDEIMTAGSFFAPLFNYTSATPIQIDLTDLFVVSDQNQVFLDGVLLGTTPAMPDWQQLSPPVGPLDPPYTSDPNVAWLTPEFSKQSFSLPAGTHLLTFKDIDIPLDPNGAPFVDGTAAFRLVPEPTSAALVLTALALTACWRRGRSAGSIRRATGLTGISSGVLCGALLLAGLASRSAIASTPCGSVFADVTAGVLEIQGTAGADSVRIGLAAGNPAVVEIYTPVGAGLPSCTFDSTSTPFTMIRVLGGDGDDLILFDDSNGAVSGSYKLYIDGGDGADIVFGGLDLNTIPLSNAMSMIATLQQAQTIVDRVLDLLDAPVSGCNTASCLVTNTATVAKNYGNDLVKPTAQYVRDMETELVQPAAAAVKDTHDRIANYLQTFMKNDVVGIAQDAQTFTANVEVSVDQFELLLPMAQDLLTRAQTLYAHAAAMGLVTQNGDPITTFEQTIETNVLTIQEFADMCAEDPEPTETDFNEDNQDPNGLSTYCAEVERRIEALESTTDGVESTVNGVEAEGDNFETDGNTLESTGNARGDDEDPNSDASQLGTQGDALVTTGDNLSTTADNINADWEAWVNSTQASLQAHGDTMYNRGQTEVLGAANTLRTQTQTDVEAAANALHAEADAILADLNTIMVAAAPLLRDDLSFMSSGSGCPVTASNTILGGPGNDVLIGSTGSDEIHGNDGIDLIIGAGGADLLYGDDGTDIIFGGGGADEIHGGAGIDILVGNGGDDCLFGGGGQTITRGSLTVQLGDIFFGVGGNDKIVSGESESDVLDEIDVAWGGDGNDRIRLSNGGDLTIGSFTFKLGNLVFGGDGDDDIETGDGIDVIFGDGDNDKIATGKGTQLSIGSGSGSFRLALGDLIFGGDGEDEIDSDDPNGARSDDDIDVIFGGDGNDTINGYGGGKLSIGDPNNPDFELKLGNLVFGGAGNDTITTLTGIDVIFGEDGADIISTEKGDLLKIGSGSNEFRLALGDLIFGGNDDDTVDSDDPNGARSDDDIDVIFGGGGADTINGYGGGKLSIGDPNNPDFELKLGNVVFGGDGDDTIVTLDGIDVIFGGDGDDTVSAGKGDTLDIDATFKINLGDLIFGGDGDDDLHGDAADPPEDGEDDGIDVIFGGNGNDRIYGDSGGKIELPDQDFCLQWGNLLFGGDGDDFLRGDYENWDPNDPRGGIDLIFGADGNDTIEGAGGSLIVVGDITAGQAVIIGFGNILFGGHGDDIIKGADTVTLCTGENDDLDNLLNGLGITDLGGAADLIFAGPGNDTVEAYNGIDFVFGSDGDDDLRADNGGIFIVPISGVPTPIAFGNIMFGGDGDDSIRSLGRLALPTVPPMEIDLLFGGPCDDNISAGDGLNLVFGNKADDIITAGDGINILFGNGGTDNITTGSGLNVAFGNRDDDTITAADGVNVLFGNDGNDTINGGNGLNIAFGNKGNDLVHAGAGVAILFGNQGDDDVAGGAGLSLCFGNKGDDRVAGGNGLCVLFGNAGNDDVQGANGLCVAFGNADHDQVTAGAGLSVLFGNDGEDRLQAGSGLSVEFGNKDNDIIQAGGGGLFIAFGNKGDDVIIGGGGLNLLFGNANNDQIFGGGGVNIAFGNANDDIIRGGGSSDFLFGNADNDQISGNGAKDFLFGNRGDDSLVSNGNNDFLFGNRGNDTVRSGPDSSDRDYLFGNRGNDTLLGCNNSDKLYGGRGSDSKDRNDCSDLSLSPPNRGEVRGVVRIDLNGDAVGDIPHAGVTVSAGSYTAVTDADGKFRIAGLPPGTYTVSETVPGGYVQVSSPATYSITIGSQGIDLHLHKDFANREHCIISPDSWACIGTTCDPNNPTLQCRPLVVRRVMRCPDTGEICDPNHDCPCSDCVPSWAVEECGCVNPQTDCYVTFTAAAEPECSGQCDSNDGTVHPCNLVIDGDLAHCECPSNPCPTEEAEFTFHGHVIEVFGSRPQPWLQVQPLQPWTISYRFIRSTADSNPGNPMQGDYLAVTSYQLQVGPVVSGGPLTPGTTLIRNNAGTLVMYGATFEVAPGAPAPTLLLQLQDPSGTAWTLAGLNPPDGLPLCDDLVLAQFPSRVLNIGVNMPGFQWSIRGAVDSFECTDCAQRPLPIVPTIFPGGPVQIQELPAAGLIGD